MGTYIPFTEQQREQARLTDLAAFLRQCGEEVKRSGSENMWLDHGQKVTIRGNLWFHQYEQVGGDAVDFVRRFYNLDYREAVLTLTSMGVGMIREGGMSRLMAGARNAYFRRFQVSRPLLSRMRPLSGRGAIKPRWASS